MPIQYASISRGAVVLANHAAPSAPASYAGTVGQILQKVEPINRKMRLAHGGYIFSYVYHDGLIFLCMADEAFPQRISWNFLVDVMRRWMDEFRDMSATAQAYEMEPLFKRTLQARMEYYSYDPNADKISKIQSQTGEVKGIMIDNMEKVLERGEKIGDIERKTEGMKVQAFRYRKKAKEVKKKMWWKNAKCWCFLVVIALVAVYLVLVKLCGGFTFSSCIGSSSSSSSSATTTPSPATTTLSPATTTSTTTTTTTVSPTSPAPVTTSVPPDEAESAMLVVATTLLTVVGKAFRVLSP